jgi:hypothetical protein
MGLDAACQFWLSAQFMLDFRRNPRDAGLFGNPGRWVYFMGLLKPAYWFLFLFPTP